MTHEEREQLRRDLEAAGCEKLSRTVAWAHWNMPAAAIFMRELRSLLRREVWVATWLEFYNGDHDFREASAVFSSHDRLIAGMVRAGRDVSEVDIEKYTIDAEVPDGQEGQ